MAPELALGEGLTSDRVSGTSQRRLQYSGVSVRLDVGRSTDPLTAADSAAPWPRVAFLKSAPRPPPGFCPRSPGPSPAAAGAVEIAHETCIIMDSCAGPRWFSAALNAPPPPTPPRFAAMPECATPPDAVVFPYRVAGRHAQMQSIDNRNHVQVLCVCYMGTREWLPSPMGGIIWEPPHLGRHGRV